MRNLLRFAFAAILAILLASTGFYLAGGNSNKSTQFPEKLSERLNLPGEADSQGFRKVIYKADGVTPDRAEVVFRNGETGIVHYRPDFSVSSYQVFYPGDEADKTKLVLKTDVELAEDGEHLVSEKRYRADGSLEVLGARLQEGSYQVTHLLEDGITRHEVHVFREGGELYSRSGFYGDGTMKFLVVTKSTFETEESRFYQDGTRASYLHQVGNLLEGETWYENGIRQTVFKRSQNWENYSYTMDVEVNYYFPAGEFDQKRTFRYNGVLVERQPGETSLAASDDAAIQSWKMINKDRPVEERFSADNLRLESISFPTLNGQEKVVVVYPESGEFPVEEHFRTRDQDKKLLRHVRYYRENRTLAREEVRNSAGKIVEKKEFAESPSSIQLQLPGYAVDTYDTRQPPVIPAKPEYVDFY